MAQVNPKNNDCHFEKRCYNGGININNGRYKKIYAQKNTAIKRSLKARNVDISKVLEKYSEGISEYHIKILYKITEDELSYILSNYLSSEIVTQRNENKKKLNDRSCNYMGLTKQQQEDNENPLSIKEALALFEER